MSGYITPTIEMVTKVDGINTILAMLDSTVGGHCEGSLQMYI